MPCPMGRGTMHRGAMHWGARVMGNLAKRVDWQGRKEGNRVDAGSGQRKAPRGNLGDEGGDDWPTCQPLPARAERNMRATKKAPRRRYPRARKRSVTGTPFRRRLQGASQGGPACSQLSGAHGQRSRSRTPSPIRNWDPCKRRVPQHGGNPELPRSLGVNKRWLGPRRI